jgi:hypothetical protein
MVENRYQGIEKIGLSDLKSEGPTSEPRTIPAYWNPCIATVNIRSISSSLIE